MQGQFTIEQADTEYVVNLCIVVHACRQTDRHTHTHTHTHTRHTHTRARAHYTILKLKEFYIYCLPLTNWSCSPFDTKALSSHGYGQQILSKTAQQCSTRTCPVSNRHNTPQHCTLLHFHSCMDRFGIYFRTFITVMSSFSERGGGIGMFKKSVIATYSHIAEC